MGQGDRRCQPHIEPTSSTCRLSKSWIGAHVEFVPRLVPYIGDCPLDPARGDEAEVAEEGVHVSLMRREKRRQVVAVQIRRPLRQSECNTTDAISTCLVAPIDAGVYVSVTQLPVSAVYVA